MVVEGQFIPTGDVIIGGSLTKYEKNVDVATNVYPGRILIKGSTDDGIKCSDGIRPPVGFAGFGGDTDPATIDDIYTVNARIPVFKANGGVRWYIPAGLAAGTVAYAGDVLFSWTNGQVIPGAYINGIPAIKIPFTKQTSEKNTLVVLPGGIIVNGAVIKVVTAVSASTIDVGILSSESNGDADGFLDGVPCATTGFQLGITTNATAANNNLGVLLVEDDVKSADATALYTSVPKFPGYITDGTAKTVTYTTTNHTIAGNIFIMLTSPGIKKMGEATYTVDATAASAGIWVEA